jgi:hypothetical protein
VSPPKEFCFDTKSLSQDGARVNYCRNGKPPKQSESNTSECDGFNLKERRAHGAGKFAFIAYFSGALLYLPAFGMNSGFSNSNRETVFSQTFLADYESAQKAVEEKHSVEPFLRLLEKYKNPDELAELELSIGLVYNQRTDLVNPTKAVEHFTNALKYQFPDRTFIQLVQWRGGSLEALKKYRDALKDYLRGLLVCAYYNLPRESPEIKEPKLPIYIHSQDPENTLRIMDYGIYRQHADLQRDLLMQRYYLIESVKNLQKLLSMAFSDVQNVLEELSPDKNATRSVVELLRSENKRPWP